MSGHGLEGIDHTVLQTYRWIDEIATGFHGSRHQGYMILRGFLHTLRDYLSIDESAQLAAQLPLLVRGLYYEGWDPSRKLTHERSAEAFIQEFLSRAGIRPMDARDALAVAAKVLTEHVSEGETRQVLMSLPAHVRELLPLTARTGG